MRVPAHRRRDLDRSRSVDHDAESELRSPTPASTPTSIEVIRE
ncbi:hypothetical protein [Haloterrigena gelatinilytica]|nr:hypothetical protein [Haloterrigena gelatinilytica]